MRDEDTETVDLELTLKHETPKAYLVTDGEQDVWLPKSLVEYDGEQTFTIPTWLCDKKGLDYEL